MFSEYTILIAQDYDGQYRNLENQLIDFGFLVSLCKNKTVDIQVDIMHLKPSIVVFDGNKLGVSEVQKIVSDVRGEKHFPILYNIYTYEDNEAIEQLTGIGVDISVPSPYNCSTIACHMKYLCENAPLDAAGFKTVVRSEIYEILKEFRLFSSRSGCSYIIDSVMYLLFERSRRVNMQGVVYPHTAEHYGVTAARVERSIRLAIQSMWKNAPDYVRKKYFPECFAMDKKPTNSEFILNISDCLYIKYREYFDKYYRENGN